MLILSFKISIIAIQTIKALQCPFPTPRTRESPRKPAKNSERNQLLKIEGWGKNSDFWPEYLPHLGFGEFFPFFQMTDRGVHDHLNHSNTFGLFSCIIINLDAYKNMLDIPKVVE